LREQGFKHYRPLFSIPHYARWSKQTGVEVRYAIVIRDGRDLALSFGGGAANSLNKAAGVLGLKGMRDIMINDIISRVQVWSEAYQQVCATLLRVLQRRGGRTKPAVWHH
jgi:hypothetical protein